MKITCIIIVMTCASFCYSQTAQIAKDVFAIPKPPNAELVRKNGEPLNHIDKPFFRILRI